MGKRPHNWQRAFNSDPSVEITVVNSWYWRSAHFTLEFEYFFEVIAPDELRQDLIEYNNLQKIDSEVGVKDIDVYLHNKPEWFVPKELTAYDIYVEESNDINHFKIFIDPETGHIFLTDYQL